MSLEDAKEPVSERKTDGGRRVSFAVTRLPRAGSRGRHGDRVSICFAGPCAAALEAGSTCLTNGRCLIRDAVYRVRCESAQDLE